MNRMYVRSFIVVCVALLLMSCKEDTIEPEFYGVISGSIRDAETGVLLEGVSVSTNPATEAVLTDVDGAFRFEAVIVGSYTISASMTEYRKGSVSVEVREGRVASAEILLEKASTINNPPDMPYQPTPQDASIGMERTVTLHWRAADKDRDSLFYDVHIFAEKEINAFRTYTGLTDTLVEVEGLEFGTTYRWQVVVHDVEDGETTGSVWSFSVRDFPPNNRFLITSFKDGNPEIYSTDTTEYNTVRLINNPSRDQWPRWNKWRSKIAFVSDRDGAYHLYTMRPDGSEQQRITSIPLAGYHNDGVGFCWTPDGGALVYPHYDKLYRIDGIGANLKLMSTATAGRHFREVEWAPQYDRMVAHTVGPRPYQSEILLLNANGSIEKELVSDVPGTLGTPSFSIDGRSVLYTQDLSEYQSDDGRQLNAHIMLMTIDQKDTLDVSWDKPDGTNDLYPRFSPDGAWVVFVNAPNDRSATGDMWIMRRDGTGRRRAVNGALYADWK